MVLLAFALQTYEPAKYVFSQVHMGVNFTVTLYANSESHARTASEKAFARIQVLDNIMSDYLPKSELNSLNRVAFQQNVIVSDDLIRVVRKAEEISKRSDGLFDITIRPLVGLWRQVRKTGKMFAPDEIEKARQLVGFEKVRLDSKTRSIRFLRDGLSLDLGGIGKGYACHEAILELKRANIKSAMVEGGGDLYCSDAPPSTKGWVVNIEGSDKTFTVRNQALSTSGSTAQQIEINGTKYSHIIDPRTCLGVTSPRQVTVVGKDGATVDALATTFCIEPKLINRFRGVKAYVVSRD